MYLIDTDVLSLLRRPARVPAVARWLDSVADDQLWLSAVTMGEIARGIELQRPRDPRFAADLEVWHDTLQRDYAARVLPFGLAEAEIWGRLSARIGNGSADLMIAATALARDLTVVTRNIRHHAPTGVRTLDPAAHDP